MTNSLQTDSTLAKHIQTVLLLGEESHNRQLLVNGLNQRGYQVIKARSAVEADRALAGQPDIVVVDQRLRGTTGLAWIKHLREDGHKMPVVFCSASNCSAKTFSVLRNLLKVSLIVRQPLEPQLLIGQMESLMTADYPGGNSSSDRHNILQFSPLAQAEMDEWAEDSLALEGDQMAWTEGSAEVNVDPLVFLASSSTTVEEAAGDEVSPQLETEEQAWTKEYNADQEMRRSLKALGRSYLGDMPEMLYALRAKIASATGDHGGAELLEAAATAHQIKGTAGSLGFPELSRLAGQIEDTLSGFDIIGKVTDREPISRALLVVVEIEAWLEAWQDDNQQWTEDTNTWGGQTLTPEPSSAQSVSTNVACGTPNVENQKPSNSVFERSKQGVLLLSDHLVNDSNQPGAELLSEHLVNNSERLTNYGKKTGAQLAFIVDPDLGRRKSLADLFRAQGNWLVETFSAGVKVLSAMEACRPDLLIVHGAGLGAEPEAVAERSVSGSRVESGNSNGSGNTKGLTGFDTCRMIRCHPEWAQLPIMITTVNTDVESRRAIYACGANDFIILPLMEEELAQRLQGFLKR
jgi:CheY-like chemotaxis protein